MDGRNLPLLSHLGMKYSFSFQFNFLCDCIFFYSIKMYENCLK